MSGVMAFEGDLNSIVLEYLQFGEFRATSDSFTSECIQLGKPLNKTDNRPRTSHSIINVENALVQHFQRGQRESFFREWVRAIPESVLQSDPVAQKIEFYLQLYFAVYPLRTASREAKSASEESMLEFKTYLETRGASLSQTTEFLPFYAIPYVPDPRNHPTYKELFGESWSRELQSRLEGFLGSTLKAREQPRLLQLYKSSVGEVRGPLADRQVLDAEKRATSYRKKLSKLQSDYHTLIGITAELVDSLENTVQGNTVSPDYLQQICVRLFSSQAHHSMDFSRPGTAGNALRQSIQRLPEVEETLVSLDFARLKRDLLSSPPRRQGLLLQALRWRLTKCAPGETRDAVLASYVSHDVLSVSKTGVGLQLVQSSEAMVGQYAARLVNALASLHAGRGYLASNEATVRQLQSLLQQSSGDVVCRENLLGALQKLSLLRRMQTVMIEGGLIHWLVALLQDTDAISEYTLEYAVALLMNLCLHPAGKRQCAPQAERTLRVLVALLGHPNHEMRPYVNGALYSILGVAAVRREGHAMGLGHMLQSYRDSAPPDMRRQLDFILKQLHADDADDDAADEPDDEDDDDEEQDAMEADLDKAEMLRPEAGELCGEELLRAHYALDRQPASTRDVGKARRKGAESQVLRIDEPLSRPVTPSHRPRTGLGVPLSARDPEAEDIVAAATGRSLALASAMDTPLGPSRKALDNLKGAADINEYSAAFGSRPKLPRTPDTRQHHRRYSGSTPRPNSAGKPPTPKYSEQEPRPSSGVRRSASNGKTSVGRESESSN